MNTDKITDDILKQLIVHEIPQPEQCSDERYFQIRNVDYRGNGTFRPFCVKGEATKQQIQMIACGLWEAEMQRKEQMHIPGFFRKPPEWRKSLQVVEQQRTIGPPTPWHISKGKTHSNYWKTKRCGYKFTIKLVWARIDCPNGSSDLIKGYVPTKK